MLAPLTLALTAAALASSSAEGYQLPLRLSTSTWQASPSSSSNGGGAGNYTSHALLRLTPPSGSVSSLKHAAEELRLDVWRASAAGCSRSTSNSAAGQGCLELRFPPLLASLRTDACSALKSVMPDVESCQVLLPDIGAVIEQQRVEGEAKALLRRKRRSGTQEEEPEAFFDDYRPIEEVEAYMRHLVATYPSLARLQKLGTTHEGRPILGLTLGTQTSESRKGGWVDSRRWKLFAGKLRRFGAREEEEPKEKVGFVIAAEMHAREFISTTVSLYFASRLLSAAAAATKSGSADLLSTFDITLIPLGNPDGYAYAWEHERLWRKNRQPGALGCHGVDPAAGFPFHFRAGYNPCSEAYPGRTALQAEETRALANFVADVDNRVVGFVDLHSYGQQLTYPFSYSCDEPLPDEEDLAELSIGAVRALHGAHRTTFATGRTCETLFTSSGTSIDYAYTSGVKWSYSMELRDEGAYGFLLPASHIRPSGEETSDALMYMLQFVKQRRGGKRLA